MNTSLWHLWIFGSWPCLCLHK